MGENDSQKLVKNHPIFVFLHVKIPKSWGWAIASALLSFGKNLGEKA
jgi:hypothetical protein